MSYDPSPIMTHHPSPRDRISITVYTPLFPSRPSSSSPQRRTDSCGVSANCPGVLAGKGKCGGVGSCPFARHHPRDASPRNTITGPNTNTPTTPQRPRVYSEPPRAPQPINTPRSTFHSLSLRQQPLHSRPLSCPSALRQTNTAIDFPSYPLASAAISPRWQNIKMLQCRRGIKLVPSERQTKNSDDEAGDSSHAVDREGRKEGSSAGQPVFGVTAEGALKSLVNLLY